jgi:addiction module HigA family antidote
MIRLFKILEGVFMPRNIHEPGPFLQLMLDKYHLNVLRMSKDIQVSQSAVRLLTIGKARISVPVAVRLAKYFNTEPEYWLMLQMRYDLAEAVKDKELMRIVRGIPLAKKVKAEEMKKAPAKKPGRPKKAAAAKKPAAGRKPAAAKKTQAAKKPAVKKAQAGRKAAVKVTAGRKAAAGKKAIPVKRGRKPAAQAAGKGRPRKTR